MKKIIKLTLIIFFMFSLVSCREKKPRVTNPDIKNVWVKESNKSYWELVVVREDGKRTTKYVKQYASITLRYETIEGEEQIRKFSSDNKTHELFKNESLPFQLDLDSYKFYYENNLLTIKKKRFIIKR